MTAKMSHFNRLLLILLVILYLISLGAFIYIEWIAGPDQVWEMAVNALLISLPLVLFYGSTYVLISAWREHRLTGQVSSQLAKVIYWAPRIASIVIIFFISLFSLDVFGIDGTPLQLLVGFIMHSLPSIFMILMLVFAWRRPMVGFVTFLIAGLFFLRFVIFGQDFGHFLLFFGPLLLISGLFYANFRLYKPETPASHEVAS